MSPIPQTARDVPQSRIASVGERNRFMPDASDVLTPDASAFLVDLHREFTTQREDVLPPGQSPNSGAERCPGFSPRTAHVRRVRRGQAAVGHGVWA